MRDDYVPPELESLLRSADQAFEPFRTRLARARELPLPDIEPPDPGELRAAAQRPDAPAELKAVERAVREGRTSWPEVISGRADRLPEVAAFHRAGARRLADARHEEPDAAPAARPPAPARPAEEWADEPPDTFMKRGW
jgi:hypothetical protein